MQGFVAHYFDRPAQSNDDYQIHQSASNSIKITQSYDLSAILQVARTHVSRRLRIRISIIVQSEGSYVRSNVESRAVELGEYIVAQRATVRQAAKKFGISKSTVHKDVAQRLKTIDPQLHRRVKMVLDVNKAQRHIRGGLATKRKYSEARQCRRAVSLRARGLEEGQL